MIYLPVNDWMMGERARKASQALKAKDLAGTVSVD